jgi:geranylgeranyl pyrophosphate synthase
LLDLLAQTCGSLAEPLTSLVAAGGKRLRPALTIALASLLGDAALSRAAESDLVAAAAAVELLHTATLVHDDLIDGARWRRGRPTLSAVHGDAAAVIGGDALIGTAFAVATSVDDHAGALVAQTLLELCRGEALQEMRRFDPTAGTNDVMEVTRLKSGSLIRTACRLGAHVVTSDAAVVEAVAEFGLEFGIVLQVVDDLIDVISTPALAGKPVGADFASGVMTLPAVLALRRHPELAALVAPTADRSGRTASIQLLRSPEVVRGTVRAACDHAAAACRALAPLFGRFAGLTEAASWPKRYIDEQLGAQTEPSLAHLLSPVELAS